MKPIVLIIVHHYLPGTKSGGPVRTISNLVEQLGDDFDFRILTTDRDHRDLAPYPDIESGVWYPVGGTRAVALALKKLGDKLTLLDVLDDPNCTHEQAMKAWDKFFLSDWFTNQPDPDDEDELDRKTTRGPTIKVGG